jgi:energy-converting hydrogenase Eha subunit E
MLPAPGLAARALHHAGAGALVLGGLGAAATVDAANPNASWVGVALATVGLVTMITPQYYKDRAEARALLAKGLAEKVEALEEQRRLDVAEKAKLAADADRMRARLDELEAALLRLRLAATSTPAEEDP